MKIDIRGLIYAIRSSFWFIPVVLGLVGLAAALTIVEADFSVLGPGAGFISVFTMSIESARMVLSAIAGSMITVAALVFSMTLLALTMVSRQLGPRVLLHFMDDRHTQFMLGLFVATFIFSLIVLLRVGNDKVDGETPGVAVAVTAALAILSLGMMLRFFHHIANRIQADVIISELGEELNRAARQFVQLAKHSSEVPDEQEQKSLDEFFSSDEGVHYISLDESGYLRMLDENAACQTGTEHDVTVKLMFRAGEFVLAKLPVAGIAARNGSQISDEALQAIRGTIHAGYRRTPEASIEYEINALVEVALRALSPGMNDAYTAIACLYRLTDGVRILMQRQTDWRVTRDEEGTIRVIHQREPLLRYLSISFDSLIEATGTQTIVLAEILRMLEDLAKLADDEQQRQAIEARVKLVAKRLERSEGEPVRIYDVEE